MLKKPTHDYAIGHNIYLEQLDWTVEHWILDKENCSEIVTFINQWKVVSRLCTDSSKWLC